VATWEAFWSDPVSNATTAADHGILLRWVRDQSLYYHASDQFAENPIAVGSTGQDVLSQWHKVMTDAAARIRDAEDRLGMNPKARAALGIALGEARKTLDDLSNAANASASSSSAVSTTPPPGLVVAGELAAPPKRTTAAKKAAPAAPVEGHDDPRLSVRS
jgi:P27 family predicted phage terminase small subunit